jgi:hypothetical protein
MESRAGGKTAELVDGENVWRRTGGGVLWNLPVLFQSAAEIAGGILDGAWVRGKLGRGAVGKGVGGVRELSGAGGG